ncbi:MAG: hypothetical protein AAGD23_09905 [Pseudomonadota bacterium]
MRTTPRTAASTALALSAVTVGIAIVAVIGMSTPTEAEFKTASGFEVTYSDEICDG